MWDIGKREIEYIDPEERKRIAGLRKHQQTCAKNKAKRKSKKKQK